MNPIWSNVCVAIAVTMYCVEEETKIKIYHMFSVYAVGMQQLENFNSTILKNMQYTSLCISKQWHFPLWRNEVIYYKNAR